MPLCYTISVDSAYVKPIKTACEASGILNTDIKIRRDPQSDVSARLVIPTSVVCENDGDSHAPTQIPGSDDQLPRQLQLIIMDLRSKSIPFELGSVSSHLARTTRDQYHASSPLQLAMNAALEAISKEDTKHACEWDENALLTLSRSYCVYDPMLLLPNTWQSDKVCQNFLDSLYKPNQSVAREGPYMHDLFYSELCKRLGVTHIAINAAIPMTTGTNGTINIIRSPSKLTPLYGDFGPTLPPFPEHYPSAEDFSKALWVSTRQNGITQVWAPKYTMFSAGNVSEKIRIARLPSVHAAVNEGIQAASGCSALDLFAGIGYFAFSYAKAGVSKVICWDLNPWSVEGFRRGANKNRWSTCIVDTKNIKDISADVSVSAQDDNVKFIVFRESNVFARQRIQDIRSLVPPIRHVNCGMLPTVGEAWKTAVEAIDMPLGGWIHIHETVSDRKLEGRTTEILSAVSAHLVTLRPLAKSLTHAQLVHVEKVKSTGPRLSHVVLDIWIPPINDNT